MKTDWICESQLATIATIVIIAIIQIGLLSWLSILEFCFVLKWEEGIIILSNNDGFLFIDRLHKEWVFDQGPILGRLFFSSGAWWARTFKKHLFYTVNQAQTHLFGIKDYCWVLLLYSTFSWNIWRGRVMVTYLLEWQNIPILRSYLFSPDYAIFSSCPVLPWENQLKFEKILIRVGIFQTNFLKIITEMCRKKFQLNRMFGNCFKDDIGSSAATYRSAWVQLVKSLKLLNWGFGPLPWWMSTSPLIFVRFLIFWEALATTFSKLYS